MDMLVRDEICESFQSEKRENIYNIVYIIGEESGRKTK